MKGDHLTLQSLGFARGHMMTAKLLKIKQNRFIIIGIVITIFALVVFMLVVTKFGWDWTGFNGGYGTVTIHTPTKDTELPPARTLWDWLGLLAALAVPVVVGFGAAWFTTQQGKVSNADNKDNQRETALQSYIDKMSELLLKEHLGELKPENKEVQKLARIRTLTVLRRLDAERKGNVLRFLHESGLLAKKKRFIDLTGTSLSGADLSGADLSGADLSRAILTGAILSNADLSRAILTGANLSASFRDIPSSAKAKPTSNDLSERANQTLQYYANMKHELIESTRANLSGTNLRGANLRGANMCGAILGGGADLSRVIPPPTNLIPTNLIPTDLSGANLSRANLSRANLNGADLTGANLSRANLRGADLSETNLSRADLHGADVTEEQLKKAYTLNAAKQLARSVQP